MGDFISLNFLITRFCILLGCTTVLMLFVKMSGCNMCEFKKNYFQCRVKEENMKN